MFTLLPNTTSPLSAWFSQHGLHVILVAVIFAGLVFIFGLGKRAGSGDGSTVGDWGDWSDSSGDSGGDGGSSD